MFLKIEMALEGLYSTLDLLYNRATKKSVLQIDHYICDPNATHLMIKNEQSGNQKKLFFSWSSRGLNSGPEKSCLQQDGQQVYVHTLYCVIVAITSFEGSFLWRKKQIKSCKCLHTEIIMRIHDLQSVLLTIGIERLPVAYQKSRNLS